MNNMGLLLLSGNRKMVTEIVWLGLSNLLDEERNIIAI